MKRTLISQATTNEPVMIQGFVEHIRNTRNMAFLVLRDRSGSLQATIEKSAHPEWNELLDALTAESVVSVTGTIVENPSVKLGGRELLPTAIELESLAAPLPLTKNANIDTRLDYRWLDLRGVVPLGHGSSVEPQPDRARERYRSDRVDHRHLQVGHSSSLPRINTRRGYSTWTASGSASCSAGRIGPEAATPTRRRASTSRC